MQKDNMHNQLIIRSNISSKLLKYILLKGSALALLGTFFLAAGSVYAHEETLKSWGWLLFLIWMGFLNLGLLPYRRLTHLQLNPHELRLTEAELVEFYIKGYKLFNLSLYSITNIEYIDHPTKYGIKLWKENAPPLFLPYFNHRAYMDLQSWKISDCNL